MAYPSKQPNSQKDVKGASVHTVMTSIDPRPNFVQKIALRNARQKWGWCEFIRWDSTRTLSWPLHYTSYLHSPRMRLKGIHLEKNSGITQINWWVPWGRQGRFSAHCHEIHRPTHEFRALNCTLRGKMRIWWIHFVHFEKQTSFDSALFICAFTDQEFGHREYTLRRTGG